MPTPSFRKTPLALAIGLLIGANVHAATITVTTTSGASSDTTECTLRAAITAANTDSSVGGCPAGSGADTIQLLPNSTITLTEDDSHGIHETGLPVIRTEMTIAGNGTTITRDATADPFRILLIASTGNLTLQKTTISNGLSSGEGGGISNNGALTLTQSTVTGNSANHNYGGGIQNVYASATLTDSTISNNSSNAFGGGIAIASSTVVINNSTISGNSAAISGGGIYINFYPAVTLTNTTISGNTAVISGSGIHNYSRTFTTLTNSILSNDGPECSGSNIVDGSNNWIEDDTCSSIPVGYPAINLGPLADNGGPTLTHALLEGSVAIDAIPPGDCIVTEDQRGVSRPQPSGGNCDIGAFEVVQDVINIDHIITFFLEELESGSLVGYSPGKGPNLKPVKAREDAFYNQLLAVETYIDQGEYELACAQIEALLTRLHSSGGDPEPNDFITGDSTDELSEMLTFLGQELGCTE